MRSSRSNGRFICVSHARDVDGCVCAALIRHATKSGYLLTNYGNFNECMKNISNKYDSIYVCDLGINTTHLEEFNRIRRFAELTYIDHHQLDKDLLTTLREMDVEVVHDLRDCASVLTYDLFREILPREASLLASYAAISDRLENGPISREIIQRHDRDFVLFEAMLLLYALERGDISFKKRIVLNLSRLEYPHTIEDVPRLALEQANRMAVLRDELPSRALKLRNIAYVESKGDSPGAVANLLLDVCAVPVGICFNTDENKQVSDLSIRGGSGLEIDLGKITSQLAESLGGFGGGHARASGARIPTLRLMKFIKALDKHTN